MSSTAWISDIKFAPSREGEDDLLALCSHECKHHMLRVPAGLLEARTTDGAAAAPKIEVHSKFKKPHNTAVTHLDFTADRQFLQTTCNGYELLFWNIETGKMETASKVRNYNNDVADDAGEEALDQQWASWTSTLGWPVQGIWAKGDDGSDINTVDRDVHCRLKAIGTDAGVVKLFRYPVVKEKASFLEFSGHSSHVTTVRWQADGSSLCSVGGGDRCLMAWKKEPVN